jgi:hypothetical protein
VSTIRRDGRRVEQVICATNWNRELSALLAQHAVNLTAAVDETTRQ